MRVYSEMNPGDIEDRIWTEGGGGGGCIVSQMWVVRGKTGS